MTLSRGYSGSSVPGPPLNDEGRVQAAAAAVLVDRVGRDLWGDIPYPSELIASPMVRTQQTAAVVGARLGLEVRTVPEFKEADFGAWEGLTAEAIEERYDSEGYGRFKSEVADASDIPPQDFRERLRS